MDPQTSAVQEYDANCIQYSLEHMGVLMRFWIAVLFVATGRMLFAYPHRIRITGMRPTPPKEPPAP